MQNSQINRVIQLVRKTGDKVVLMDNESEAVLMLMDLGVYEKMLSTSPQRIETLTEEELMEKINRDVAVWRAYNDKDRVEKTAEEMLEDSQLRTNTRQNQQNQAVKTENSMPVPRATANDSSVTSYPANSGTEESAADIVAEEDEEKFYLEPIE